MLNCWSEFADKRPTFPDLVREFDRMITMLSDKVNVIRRMTKNIFVIPPTFEEFFQLFNSQTIKPVRLLPREHLYSIPILVILNRKICCSLTFHKGQ